jgi:hypothetical protein
LFYGDSKGTSVAFMAWGRVLLFLTFPFYRVALAFRERASTLLFEMFDKLIWFLFMIP